ncbi:hypothetical protein K9K85_02340 [Patescibacteria group bacterium]|nr:hypothetical protein [Patescibacteria group bacterium]
MAIEVKRKQKEALNVFLRRFSERVKRSGIINDFKKSKFYLKPKSKNLKRKSALERKKKSEKMKFLKKVGKAK